MARLWVNGGSWVEVKDAEGINIVHLTVDNKEIAVSGGQTILEAVARMPGIGNIPALCYHPAVKPNGACQLCTVEVSENGGSKFRFVVACLYPVKEGLVVKTNTKMVRKRRKGIIEPLLARCPNVKKIQELAEEYGVEKPRVALLGEDCIHCSLCLRACQETIGKAAISLVTQGIYKEVAASFYGYQVSEEDCIGCGDCAFVCPTGTIQMGPDGKPVLPKVKIPYSEVEAMSKRSSYFL
ncbi:MAG: 4Fe-4S dicluster domain-containing protein [Dehalococcoidia bacterium]|nr:MAG: 4Fe-4S dicluster domain-containing protein [Dehalococcoidia bacterium]